MLEVEALPASTIGRALHGLQHLRSVRLVDRCLAAAPALPHLRSLAAKVYTPEAVQQLAAAVPQLTSVTQLIVEDAVGDDEAALVQLPGLRELGSLRELVCISCVPPQAWYCPQLTALTCQWCRLDDEESVSMLAQLPEPPQLAGLRRLELRDGCSFSATFPPELCQLTGLTSLLWMEATDGFDSSEGWKDVPRDFSRLRCAAAPPWLLAGSEVPPAGVATLYCGLPGTRGSALRCNAMLRLRGS